MKKISHGEEHYDIGLMPQWRDDGRWLGSRHWVHGSPIFVFEAHFVKTPPSPIPSTKWHWRHHDLLGIPATRSGSSFGVQAWDGSGFGLLRIEGMSFGPATVDAALGARSTSLSDDLIAPRVLHRLFRSHRLVSLGVHIQCSGSGHFRVHLHCVQQWHGRRALRRNRRVGRSQHRACPRCMVALGWPRPPSSQPSRLIDFQLIPREWWR